MRTFFALAGVLLLSLLLAPPAFGQAPAAYRLSEEAEISLLTILPGDDIPSMYGHSALRVRDPLRGIDWTYNYGTYDFSDPLFIPKFLYGDLQYFLHVSPYPEARLRYRYQQRPIIEQTLRLSAAQKNAVFRLLQVNARPENRFYRYDFFFDNCSTRPRDVLKAALGEDLRFAESGPAPPQSFRHLIDPYAADRPFLDLGMDLLLGLPADRIATPWQEMFLPEHLMEALERARVRPGEDASLEPLVTRTDMTTWGGGYTPPQPALPWPTLLGWLLFVLGLGVTFRHHRRDRPGRPLPDALLLFSVGLAGTLAIFLTFVALHEATEYNMHVLWMWPAHLWAAYVLMRERHSPFLHGYLWAAAGAALLLAVGWPLWPQDLHAATLPLMLLVALRCGWRAYATKKRTPAAVQVPS